MTDLEKPKTTRKKKPPTQTAGVTGIDAHGSMGDAPIEPAKPSIDWQKLISLPAFEMFVFEESGQTGSTAGEWVSARRTSMGDKPLYELYAKWHRAKGYWSDETPMGELMQGAK